MPKKFNPYTTWLMIPADQLPPDYYRLLGLRRFESDTAKVAASVEKRVAFLQDVSNGPHVEHAQRLLGEVAKAGLCLKNPERRQKYDQKLKHVLSPEKLKIDLPEITQLPDPDEWVFKGALPEATVVQKKKRRTNPVSSSQGDPLGNNARRPLPSRRAAVPATEKRTFNPAPILINLLLLTVAGLGGFWLLNNFSDVADQTGSTSLESEMSPGAPTVQPLRPTIQLIEEDFESAEFASENQTVFATEMGQWDFGSHVTLDNFDENLRHLHIHAGQKRFLLLTLNPSIALPAELEMDCECVQRELIGDDFLVVETSADQKTWTVAPKRLKSKRILDRERNQGTPTPNRVYFWLTDVKSKFVRVTCNSQPNSKSEKEGGLLIGRMKLSPLTQQMRDQAPSF